MNPVLRTASLVTAASDPLYYIGSVDVDAIPPPRQGVCGDHRWWHVDVDIVAVARSAHIVQLHAMQKSTSAITATHSDE